MSIFLNTVFQLAHVLEKTTMVTHADYKVESNRAVHQLQTTADFATKNKIWTWLLG
jgi:linoleoyl-CoA desaturase